MFMKNYIYQIVCLLILDRKFIYLNLKIYYNNRLDLK
jgi:hypothetical protein